MVIEICAMVIGEVVRRLLGGIKSGLVIGLLEEVGRRLLGGIESGLVIGFLIVCGILLSLTLISVSIRRMHDLDKSGWWILVPVYSWILVTFVPGTPGSNRFGPCSSSAKEPMKLFNFSGRATRVEWWTMSIFAMINTAVIHLQIILLIGIIKPGLEVINVVISVVIVVVIVVVIGLLIVWGILVSLTQLTLSIRRMHDLDKSGWWILVPIYSWILVAFVPGTPGSNRFGPCSSSAKEPGSTDNG